MPENRFQAALRVLVNHKVEFVVVGGIAANLRGAVYSTLDLDIVHSRDEQNVVRLLKALEALDARYRYRPDFRPNESHLSSPGHQLLMTSHGKIDFLGQIGPGMDYAGLLGHSSEVELEPGLKVRVLDLETIIASKEAAGAEKDLAVLPLLRRTLQESRRLQTAQTPQSKSID